ncbi:hypothetical protein V9T40_008589 [Parthenolecanium corni]|uniref:furin n=1 Tax=Parthenolecanium corni TaxID=536013 RepID=A0AAN9U035_9HEMI
MFAMLMMICSSTSAWKMQHNVSKFKHKHDELKGFVKPNNQHYTNTWVSFIEGGSHLVQKIADIHGYVILKEIFPNTYHLHHPKVKKRSLEKEEYFSQRLTFHPQVLYVEQQMVKRRIKRDYIMLPFPSSKSKYVGGDDAIHEETWQKVNASHHGILSRATFAKNDPKWPDMWYLNRGGEQDMNVRGAWEDGYSGLGIVVTILDDGLEKDHPDLIVNYDPQASYDINGHDEDPMPRYDQTDSNRHGTRCAGEVAAAANNNRCSVGVAFRASIGGIRMLDGDVTDAVEARSLSLNSQHIDIYSASWGPDDDGKTVDGPGELAMRAFVEGVTKGRGGKGSIFVWASGNGGRDYDNCNCDGYTNSIYTLSVSSATEAGKVPWYSEICSSTIASTYSSGALWEPQVSTTDLHHDCTGNHTGTSASAPLAAGIIALALEANTELTWRDMQHIVIATARPKGLIATDWNVNGVGRAVSHSFGYGLMDATAMVRLARHWKRVGRQQSYETDAQVENAAIPSNGVKIVRLYVQQAGDINYLEHVQARITLDAKKRGDIRIILISPVGTRSVLLTPRMRDSSRDGFQDWPFMTVHCWGESPLGTWKLELHNQGRLPASFIKWKLVLYGTETNPAEENNLLKTNISEKSVVQMKRTQSEIDENSPVNEEPTARFDSVKNFRDMRNAASKFSFILSCFPLIWTLKILACS